MTDEFSEQLVQRVLFARPNPALEDYSLYVRLARLRLGMDRAELSRRTGLERSFLTFLENGLLLPDELTEEVCDKIERALGPYLEFLRSNEDLMAELRQDWGHNRFTAQGDNQLKHAAGTGCGRWLPRAIRFSKLASLAKVR